MALEQTKHQLSNSILLRIQTIDHAREKHCAVVAAEICRRTRKNVIDVHGTASIVVTCHNLGRRNIIKLDKTPLARSQGGQAF